MKQNGKSLLVSYIVIVSVFIFFGVAFYFIGGDQLKQEEINTKMPEGNQVAGEITKGFEVKQKFVSSVNHMDDFSVFVATYARSNQGTLEISLYNQTDKKLIAKKVFDVFSLKDNSVIKVGIEENTDKLYGKDMELTITSNDGNTNNAITVYYNKLKSLSGGELYLNGKRKAGMLCFSVHGSNPLIFGKYYWSWLFVSVILLSGFFCVLYYKLKKGKQNKLLVWFQTLIKYKFLAKQLIARDFKTKYKRSVLGFCWSFLNPLLTMIMQYVVFSTVFRNNIENFPVYLLTGSIIFNFFTESVGVGLCAIINNAPLITKVYVPKYIYPTTRVLSTSINLFISFIPLLLTVIFTGEKITVAFLLLPFIIACIIIFCLGMTLALSSFMVFFRDTQFLWGILSMLWMYATPLFYPESIIPEKYSFILKFNPMYHYIKFGRTILLDGISPVPTEYLICLVFSLISLIVGGFIFRISQDKFALYI